MQNDRFVISAQKTVETNEEVVVFDSLTNVRHGDTIASHSTKGVMTMTAMNSFAFSCSTAVATAPACNDLILDTARILAVSICVLLVRICRMGA